MLELNKEEFLKTELGRAVEMCIRSWDKARDEFYANIPGTYQYRIAQHLSELYLMQWTAYRMAIKQFYGVEYNLTREDEYFGIVADDETDWLIKIKKHPEKKLQFYDNRTMGSMDEEREEQSGMLEGFQKKVESIAENYADLVDKAITEASATEVLESGKMNEINDGIRLLNHIANTLERIDRVQKNQDAHGQN